MSKPENPHAFPSMGLNPWKQQIVTDPGMSLRDYIAVQAMSGLLANGTQRLIAEAFAEDGMFGQSDHEWKAAAVNEQLALGCYQIADAMLAARLSGDEKP